MTERDNRPHESRAQRRLREKDERKTVKATGQPIPEPAPPLLAESPAEFLAAQAEYQTAFGELVQTFPFFIPDAVETAARSGFVLEFEAEDDIKEGRLSLPTSMLTEVKAHLKPNEKPNLAKIVFAQKQVVTLFDNATLIIFLLDFGCSIPVSDIENPYKDLHKRKPIHSGTMREFTELLSQWEPRKRESTTIAIHRIDETIEETLNQLLPSSTPHIRHTPSE